MGNLKKNMKKGKTLINATVDISKIAGSFSKAEEEKLLSGSGFVKVPSEELKRLRVDIYPSLM